MSGDSEEDISAMAKASVSRGESAPRGRLAPRAMVTKALMASVLPRAFENADDDVSGLRRHCWSGQGPQ